MMEEESAALGLEETPRVFIYDSNGVMNAMAPCLVGRHRSAWLTSALIDTNDDDQVRFVIGYEFGHHVAGLRTGGATSSSCPLIAFHFLAPPTLAPKSWHAIVSAPRLLEASQHRVSPRKCWLAVAPNSTKI